MKTATKLMGALMCLLVIAGMAVAQTNQAGTVTTTLQETSFGTAPSQSGSGPQQPDSTVQTVGAGEQLDPNEVTDPPADTDNEGTWVEKEGLLKSARYYYYARYDTVLPADIKAIIAQQQLYYYGTLADNDGAIIAYLISKEIRLISYYNKPVKIGGYLVERPDAASDDTTQLIDVRKLDVIVPPEPPWIERVGNLTSQYMSRIDADTKAMLEAYNPEIVNLYYYGTLADNDGNVVAYLVSRHVSLPYYNGKRVKVGGYEVKPKVASGVEPADILVIDVRKIEEIVPPPPPMVDRTGEVADATYMYRVPEETREELKAINPNILTYYYYGALTDNDGEVIAHMVSKRVALHYYNAKEIKASGYIIEPVSDNDGTTSLPVLDVQKVEVILPPPPPWVERRGRLESKYMYYVESAEKEALAAINPDIVKHSYYGKLYDNDGNLSAYLVSRTVPLHYYNGKIVKVGGYEIKPSTDSTSADQVIVIDVRKLEVIPPPPPPTITRGGKLKSIYMSQVDADLRAQLNECDSSVANCYYFGTLHDNDGAINAYLVSRTVPLPRYNGYIVRVKGFLRGSIGADDTTNVGIPVIDVQEITIIYIPPPVYTWTGIAYPNETNAAEFILKNENGGYIGYLTTKDEAMMTFLKDHTADFIIKVTGPVTSPSYYSSVRFRTMEVKEAVVMADLRKVVWMRDDPLTFTVGEKVNFNKIGGLMRLRTYETDNDGYGPLPNLPYNTVYQKYWDFDLKVKPMPMPVDNDSIIPADNDGTVISDNDGMPDNDSIVPAIVPVEYVDYDFMYDSRIKIAITVFPPPYIPIHVFDEPGMYKITLTGVKADSRGVAQRVQSASRLIRVVPATEETDPSTP